MNMTHCIQYCQRKTGYPRFNFMSADEMRDTIIRFVIPDFSTYFKYKCLWRIDPLLDAVDQTKYPGLFKIVPTDCPVEKIQDVGQGFSSAFIASGGYPRDMGRTIYGGAMGVGAVLYNQLNANIMSMCQPQQLTTEYIKPNMVQLYPKRAYYQTQVQIMIELICDHSDDLRTIPDEYQMEFLKMSLLYIKDFIYQKYKDWDDETVAGHQVRTKIQEYSSAEGDLNELRDALDDESFKCYDSPAYDFFIV